MENTLYLSCSGGGTKGLIYAGVLDAMEDHMIRTGKSFEEWRASLKGLSGTSAGSICCLAVLLGLDKYQRSKIIKNIFSDMRNIVPCPDITLMVTSYGLENGNTFKTQIQAMLNESGLNPETTLGDIKRLFGKEFVCVCTDIQKQEPIHLSSSKTPNVKVYDAIYMSCSIPFVFAPMKYEGNYIVDGSITEDIPNVFDNSKTLFLVIHKNTATQHISSWPDYIYCFLKVSLCFQKNKEKIKDRTCVLITENEYTVSQPPFDLFMTESVIEKFVAHGYMTVLNMLTHNEISEGLGKLTTTLADLLNFTNMDETNDF